MRAPLRQTLKRLEASIESVPEMIVICDDDAKYTTDVVSVLTQLLECPDGGTAGEPISEAIFFVLRCLMSGERAAELVREGAVDLLLRSSIVPEFQPLVKQCMKAIVDRCANDELRVRYMPSHRCRGANVSPPMRSTRMRSTWMRST